MGNIHQLDSILANQIAAGEVIERPANVVKELVENSIDANSSHVYIYVVDGGLTMMKVVDDGCGMDEEDARMCFLTHATSKIKTNFDLFNITTLGFRGEAIPSIASVSHFELTTSTKEAGTRIVYEYGKKISEGYAVGKKGTTIEVTKLFQNVPARLKYMKSVNYEFSRILSMVERFALSHPEVSFQLYHQDKLVFHTSGNGQLIEVFGQIYGLAVARNMIYIENENDEFKIEGYISRIDTSRASKNNMITLINSRVVRSYTVVDAINQAYRDYLANDRYPISMINVTIDPFLVDVNVHPSKMEVRFSKESELHDLINQTVVERLKQENLVYQVQNKETEKERVKVEQVQLDLDNPALHSEDITPVHSFVHEPAMSEPAPIQEVPSYQEKTYSQDTQETNISNLIPTKKPILKKIYAKCQIHGTYIVGENQEGLYLVDQHAAKERINYEYFKERFVENSHSFYDLLVPIVLDFPQSEAMLLRERRALLEGIGIYIEEFGENSFVVKKLPAWMQDIDERIYIETMCDSVIHQNRVDVMALQEHAIATLACKASVKGNTYLSMNEMQGLLDDLMRIENPYVCPHGRPTILFYSSYELEKLFKRVV